MKYSQSLGVFIIVKKRIRRKTKQNKTQSCHETKECKLEESDVVNVIIITLR